MNLSQTLCLIIVCKKKGETMFRQLLIISILLLSITMLNAQDGTVDQSFAINGHTMTQILEDKNSAATNVLVLSDGKILASGIYDNYGRNAVTAVRYNTDGSLDEAFGEGGIVQTYFAETQVVGEQNGLGLQSDGKIIISGYTTSATDYDFAVMRLNSDGSVDSSFGTDGRTLTEIGDKQDYAYGLTIQDDDKIVMVGRRSDNTGSDAIVVRYTGDGHLDASFGTDGVVAIDFDGGADDLRTVEYQSNGKIVAGGYSSNFGLSFILIKLLPDGSLDTSFDQDGKLKIDTLTGQVHSLALLNQNQILLAGSNGGENVQLAKVNADGTLDASFGNSGTLATNFVNGGNDGPQKLLVQSDNKFIVTGTTWLNGPWVMSGQRFNADGTVDNTFADNGSYFVDLNEQDFSRTNDAAMAPDGSIYIAGRTLTDKRIGIFTVLKLNNNATPLVGVEEDEDVINNSYTLSQNYPNPFNPSTQIKFSIPKSGFVSLKIYDVLGKEVTNLVSKDLNAGSYSVKFNAEVNQSLASGVYFYRLESGQFSQTKKLMLIK